MMSARDMLDNEFDLDFRPTSYSPEFPNEETFLARIKGTARRDIAKRALAGEEPVRLGDETLYREAMEFRARGRVERSTTQELGFVHPAMLGGSWSAATGNWPIARPI